MPIFYRAGFVAVLGWLLSGCASLPAPAWYYDEIVVVNQTRSLVRDVEITAPQSGRVFACGNIAPRGICSNRFRPQAYSGNPVRVAWAIGDGRRRDETVVPELAPGLLPEIPLRGVLVIGAQGGITAFLQQDRPGPHL